MGGNPYWYYVDYVDDVGQAIESLRQREFEAGRYYPANPMTFWPFDQKSTSQGRLHNSIDEAMLDGGPTGTRSILDLSVVGDERDFCVAARLSDEELLDLYDTIQPTHEMIESNMPDCDRGEGVYIVVYKNGQPDEILFAGCSFD